MKNLRKLLKSIIGDGIVVVAVMVILLLLAIYYGEDNAPEDIILRLFVYLVFAGVVFVAAGIYLIVVFYYYGNVKAGLRAIPGFSEERFARETERGPQFKWLLASCDAICYAGAGHMAQLIPIADIIWVYQPAGVNGLWIYTKEREIHKVSVYMKGKGAAKNAEKGIRYLMRLIARKNKNVIIGYSEAFEELYRHDFAQLLGMAGGREIIDSGCLEREYIENDYYHKDFQ